jgi:acid stress-induced BolA-like protein IbaG/YrbA
MDEHDIKRAIEAEIPDAWVQVEGDGRHFQAIVVSDVFAQKSRLQRHRAVYDALGSSFDTEALHALSVQTYTPEQWETRS